MKPLVDYCHSVGCDLSYAALDVALAKHRETLGHDPVTLVVGPENLTFAYELVRELKLRLLIVPVPGLPRSLWFVCSPGYAVGSGSW